ncbi:hypothetical protein HYS48_04710 [Candidatus Woesearchaeota archaeon]|nr:hypothetical protein [Candidatus Woesearchaeota archaeon]
MRQVAEVNYTQYARTLLKRLGIEDMVEESILGNITTQLQQRFPYLYALKDFVFSKPDMAVDVDFGKSTLDEVLREELYEEDAEDPDGRPKAEKIQQAVSAVKEDIHQELSSLEQCIATQLQKEYSKEQANKIRVIQSEMELHIKKLEPQFVEKMVSALFANPGKVLRTELSQERRRVKRISNQQLVHTEKLLEQKATLVSLGIPEECIEESAKRDIVLRNVLTGKREAFLVWVLSAAARDYDFSGGRFAFFHYFMEHVMNQVKEEVIGEFLSTIPWVATLTAQNKRFVHVLLDRYPYHDSGGLGIAYLNLVHSDEPTRRRMLEERNAAVLYRLEKRGIDLQTYFHGIGKVFFDLRGSQYNKEELYRAAKEEAETAMRNLYRMMVGSERFVQKVYDTLGIPRALPQQDPLEHIFQQVDNQKTLQRFLALALDYCTRKQHITDSEPAEVHLFHVRNALNLLRMKIPQSREGIFGMDHCRKDLVKDVSIGYESGCCLLEPRILPHMIDHATQFTEFYIGDARRGMAMLFAAEQQGEPALVVNSIELSNVLRGYERRVLDQIVDKMLGYIIAYGKKAGFRKVVLGANEYATSYNYGTLHRDKPQENGIKKIGPAVFSDVMYPFERDRTIDNVVRID